MRGSITRCPGPIRLPEDMSADEQLDVLASRVGWSREQAAELLAVIALAEQKHAEANGVPDT